MHRLFPLALVCVIASLATGVTRAQDVPVFTAPMVHPLGTPDSTAARPDAAAARPVDRRPVPIGKTPRAHADELATVFERACLAHLGDPDAAADWALNHGFVAASDKAAPQGIDTADQDKPANVFSRATDGTSVLLMSVASPNQCSVMARRAVDGVRLRGHVLKFATKWGDRGAQPVPSMDMRLLQGTPLKPARMLGYKFAVGNQFHALMATIPEQPGDGVAFIALMVSEAEIPAASAASSVPQGR